MNTYIVTGLLFLISTGCFGGILNEDPRTFPVLIAHNAGTGSGCLLRLSNSVYLVTAKHVLFADPVGTNAPALLSPTAFLKSYSRAGTTNVSERTIELDLSVLLGAGEIRYSTNRDVALVRIEECETNRPDLARPLSAITFLSPAVGLHIAGPDWICLTKDIDVGADVFMFGYPISITGQISQIFDPSEPLLRKGIVAGVNLQRKTVIIDCPSYFGNSGGPVLQVEHLPFGQNKYSIIGLVSGFVPFQEEWENKTMKYSHVIKSNSGYTVIEPIDIALELAWQ